MRTQINTMEITNSYKEVEIKSAVCIGLDYGFRTVIDRTYHGTIVRFVEIYTDGRKWDIEEIRIEFLNDNDVNEENKNRITVLRISTDTKSKTFEEISDMSVFNTWGEALQNIMNMVWSIENA